MRNWSTEIRSSMVVVAFGIATASAFGADTNAPAPAPQPAPPIANPSSTDVESLIQILQKKYVNPAQVTEAEMNKSAVQGIIAALGPGAELVSPAPQAAASTNQPPALRTDTVVPMMGYIWVKTIDAATIKQVDEALTKFDKEKVDSVVIDLRFTKGGTFTDAAEFAGKFLLKDRLLFTVRSAQGTGSKSFVASQSSAFIDWKLSVLVNNETDGAAEAVAAVLREQARALVVGGKTTGKAVLWSEEALPSGTKVRIATGKVVTAGGVELFPKGVIPDVPTDTTVDAERKLMFELSVGKPLRQFVEAEQTEKRLNEAALVKMMGKGETGELPEPAEDSPKKDEKADSKPKKARPMDVSLQRAVDILKGIRILHLD